MERVRAVVAGAGGRIGSAAVAKSDADGYTLLMCSAGPITISPSLYSDLPYAPDKDFEPVVLIGAGVAAFAWRRARRES